jgi:uncharacterized protein YabN with tetrapyrrole methylase and pyrophosphatase domain
MKAAFEKLVHLNHHLGKDCAWCREQTIESFCKHLVEEAKEVEAAISKDDADELKEELGDLMWNVIFMARIAEKHGLFTMKDMLEATHAKISRRHPHVFGEKTEDIDKIWELYHAVKAEEKKEKEGRERRPIKVSG